ncbi:MAG: retroviral-like aspartic protease [Candidatus Aenigmarchaeota archaeon]|nr:retroviral-like aspartic protease [Candidatus Aenigmarchaeota archaeon]
MRFSYTEKESRVVGRILKPLIEVEILSKDGLWYGLDEVLADTGADITLIPKYVGEEILHDIKSGEKTFVKGIGPGELTVYIHTLTIRVANKEFKTKAAIADSDEAPAVLGRFEAIDVFNAKFTKGKELILE